MDEECHAVLSLAKLTKVLTYGSTMRKGSEMTVLGG